MPGGNQLAKYKCARGFELGATETKSSKSPERDSNSEPSDYGSDELTSRPCCLGKASLFRKSIVFESVFGLRERWPRYTDFSLIFCSFAPVYRWDVATSCPGVRRLPFQNLQGSWKALNIFSYLSLLNRLLKTSWPSRQPPPLFL